MRNLDLKYIYHNTKQKTKGTGVTISSMLQLLVVDKEVDLKMCQSLWTKSLKTYMQCNKYM
jgi:hypothetical protein